MPPNEALGLPEFETHNGSTSTYGVNYNETLSSVGQRRQDGFSSPLPAGAIDPNLFPHFPVSTLDVAAQFAPFLEPEFAPMTNWQCPQRQSPSSKSGMFNSFLQTAMRPETNPVEYTSDYVSNVQLPGGMGCQAPIPSVTRETTPQYPDVQYMSRAANLLVMPKHVPQEENPVYKEVPRKLNHVPSVQEKTPREFKDAVRHQKKSPKSHRCNFCQKIYSRQSALKIHMRIHTGERPYSCADCKRAFNQAGGLKTHTRLHTGEKPFKCDICDRRFAPYNTARYHKRLHTGEKPFKCEHGCGKSFVSPTTLKTHERTHTGDKPFQCPLCFKTYTQHGNLNRHIRCKHNQGVKK